MFFEAVLSCVLMLVLCLLVHAAVYFVLPRCCWDPCMGGEWVVIMQL